MVIIFFLVIIGILMYVNRQLTFEKDFYSSKLTEIFQRTGMNPALIDSKITKMYINYQRRKKNGKISNRNKTKNFST